MKPARRYLAVHLPFWEAEHLRQSHPDLPADTPLALWARQGARRLLVAVDQAAAAAGLEAALGAVFECRLKVNCWTAAILMRGGSSG